MFRSPLSLDALSPNTVQIRLRKSFVEHFGGKISLKSCQKPLGRALLRLPKSGLSLTEPYWGQVQQMTSVTSVQRVKSTTGQVSRRSRIAGGLFKPVLASLLEERWVALLLLGIGILQVGLAAVGLQGWQCPVRATLGVPCPGCGLSTAMALLLRGEWRAALSTHAFAPIFLLGFALLAVVSALPGRLHREATRRIAALERRTGIVTFVLLSLVVYWGVRLRGLL